TRFALTTMGDVTARAAAPASNHSSARAEPFDRDNGGGRTHLAARPKPRSLKLTRILTFDQAGILAAVVGSLIVAGCLKGIIGVGMPVVALPLLSLFIDVKSAAM